MTQRFCLYWTDHSNYAGFIENIGPCVVSIVEDKENNCTRALVRIPHNTQTICIDASSSGLFSSGGISSLKTVLGKTAEPSLPKKNLKKIKNPDLVKELINYDNSHVRRSHSPTLPSLTFLQIVMKYKFGVLYCKEGQTTEEEWFGNGASHSFSSFSFIFSLPRLTVFSRAWQPWSGPILGHHW